MTKVTSKNRTQARRLLNNWHDSKHVAHWTLDELYQSLVEKVNQGLITTQGIDRALNIDRTPPRGEVPGASESEADRDAKAGMSEEYQEGYDDAKAGSAPDDGLNDNSQEYREGYADGQVAKDGEGEGEGDNESDSDDDDMSEQRDDDAPADDSDDESENESESEQEKEPELRCDACDKFCTEDELVAGAEGTPREGEALCKECNEENDNMLDDEGRVKHPMLDTVIKYLSAGIPVALIGPTGSGKSVLADMAFDVLELDKHGCGAMLSKYDLIGFVDANGNYHATPLFNAVTKGGGFCFDELDASAPDAVVAFNAVTDGQKTFTFPHGQHVKHESLRVISCLNTYGNGASADYVGRYKQDAAAMNRYAKVFIDYDPNVEKLCGPKDIVSRCQSVRVACTTLGIRHIVSTRTIALSAKARAAKATKAEIDRDLIFAGLDAAAITQIKAQMRKGAA